MQTLANKPKHQGFTLVELLVSIVIIVVLSGLALSTWKSARANTQNMQCVSSLRQIGVAIQLYAADHKGEFPRSLHSAGAHRQPGWSRSIYPYLTGADQAEFQEIEFNRLYRCPVHKETNPNVSSYGLNVFFELDPRGDDYVGAPMTWRKIAGVRRPARTILVAETRPHLFGDHLMSHLWHDSSAVENALAWDRHAGKSNFLFVDGHVESLLPQQTLDVKNDVNLWNPSLAR